jgi:hypothetical protein
MYSPLYFLAALGAGGLFGIIFFDVDVLDSASRSTDFGL